MKDNKILNGDCLELMKDIPNVSIDMILCDLPYGTTACKWDTIIPFDRLWQQYERIIKPNGAIVLTASQPFTSALVMSNIKMFKYEWIYTKNMGGCIMNAKTQPMKQHENILVFSIGKCNYYPQREARLESGKNRVKYKVKGGGIKEDSAYSKNGIKGITTKYDETRYPKSFQYFNVERGLHPTQKPVTLFEYLIKTYTNEGELVLDNCAGSFTTAIACLNTNRNYICMEKDENYFKIGEKRILEWYDKDYNLKNLDNEEE
jgi:site-specific DNA-methyltransferase (adenine-specific)